MQTDDQKLVVDYQAEDDMRRQRLIDAGIDELEVIASCKRDMGAWTAYFAENNTRGRDSSNFVVKDQWTSQEIGEFQRLGKPALTVNKVYDGVKKIVGEQRQNKPDLKVRSLTGRATQEQINLRADLVRTISYQSQNDLVYQTAFNSAMIFGYGAFEVGTDWESRSFNQRIEYRLCKDMRLLFWDPTAEKPHKGDGNCCGRLYIMGKDEFYAEYPYVQYAQSYMDANYIIDFPLQSLENIIICHYWRKEWFPSILFELSNGEVVTEAEWEIRKEEYEPLLKIAEEKTISGEDSPASDLIVKDIPYVVNQRLAKDYKIMSYKLINDRVLEFAEFPSKHLPLIFVDGDSQFIDGKQFTRTYAESAKDSQRALNYQFSELMTEVKNRRREQWLVTADNIRGNEMMWRNPEIQVGALVAQPDPKSGAMPQKLPPSEIPQSLMALYQATSNTIYELMGYFGPDLQNDRGDASGKAIYKRQMGRNSSAYTQFDNLNQSLEQSGRVVLDLLPVVYTRQRHVVLSKPGGETSEVILNKDNEDGTIENELTAGSYDIEMDCGPSFAMQHEEAVRTLIDLVQVNPQVFNLTADIIGKNLNVQFMPQLVSRLRHLVPPEILAEEEGRPPPPPKPDPMQQMMQMQTQLAEAQLAERAEELKIRQEKHEIEKSRLALDATKLAAEMQKTKMNNETMLTKADLDYSAKVANSILGHHYKSETSSKTQRKNI